MPLRVGKPHEKGSLPKDRCISSQVPPVTWGDRCCRVGPKTGASRSRKRTHADRHCGLSRIVLAAPSMALQAVRRRTPGSASRPKVETLAVAA
jgi:hypothetical protein